MAENVIDCSRTIVRTTVFTNMLNAPIAILSLCNDIDLLKDLLNTRAFILFVAVLKYVLNNKTASFTHGNIPPLPRECCIHKAHDLRWLNRPTKLKQLLPNVTGIPMFNSVWNG